MTCDVRMYTRGTMKISHMLLTHWDYLVWDYCSERDELGRWLCLHILQYHPTISISHYLQYPTYRIVRVMLLFVLCLLPLIDSFNEIEDDYYRGCANDTEIMDHILHETKMVRNMVEGEFIDRYLRHTIVIDFHRFPLNWELRCGFRRWLLSPNWHKTSKLVRTYPIKRTLKLDLKTPLCLSTSIMDNGNLSFLFL